MPVACTSPLTVLQGGHAHFIFEERVKIRILFKAQCLRYGFDVNILGAQKVASLADSHFGQKLMKADGKIFAEILIQLGAADGEVMANGFRGDVFTAMLRHILKDFADF